MVALGLVLLLTCVALAVDGARLYAEGLRVQKAADLAALTGVTQVSNGTDSTSLKTIMDPLVKRNMPLMQGASFSETPTLTSGATNQLKVQVREDGFPLFFAPIFGFKSATVTREASAQYNAPVPMGNPTGTLGDPGGTAGQISVYQPDNTGTQDNGTATPKSQNMKLSINGPDSLVENGDPYSPLNVLSDPSFGGSSIMANQFRAQANPAFNGYDYRVTVTSNALTDYTYIQVYDAATCSTSFNDLTSGAGFGVPSPPFVYNGNTNFATFYSLYKYNSATNQKTVITDQTPNLTLGRDPSLSTTDYPYPVVIAPTETCNPTYAGKWYTLAKITGATKGDSYIVNVSTCLDASTRSATTGHNTVGYTDPADPPSCYGGELNNFALRAVTTSDGSCLVGSNCQSFSPLSSSQPTLGGMGRISVEVNAPGTSGKTFIYLARIAQVYKGKWLMIKLFDPGDVNQASSIQIVRPDGSYAPFMWYTQTLDGSGSSFTTPMRNIADNSGNILNKSLITSLGNGGECVTSAQCSGPTYSVPPTATPPNPASSSCNQLTSDPTGPGSTVAPAYGQTMAENNPFDPTWQSLCTGMSPKSWGSPSSAFPSDNSTYGGSTDGYHTHYYDYNYSTIGANHYQPFNGRWVYMFTQIPSNYDDGSTITGAHANTYPGWWYVQYSYAASAGSFTDRTTWEASVIDTPPHLVN